METQKKLEFTFTDELFHICMGREPKNQDELNQYAKACIDTIEGMINWGIIDEAVRDAYITNDSAFPD